MTLPDGINYSKIGIINGKGTTSIMQYYSFPDNNPPSQKLYYRIKQVDIDGNFEYSKIISISADGDSRISIYPNPVVNKLVIDAKEKDMIKTLQLTDLSGKQLPVSPSGTGSLFHYDLSNLPRGLYLLRIVTKKEVITKSISKL